MKHTIEYNGERKTVIAKSTATVNEVLAIAFPHVRSFDMSKVVINSTGRFTHE